MKVLDLINRFIHKVYHLYAKQEIGNIYVLHRVVSESLWKTQKNIALEISESQLRELIWQKRAEGYQFVSLKDFLKYKKRTFVCHKKLATITFDDGYKDNYTLAAPILNELQVPFTIFISTDIVDHKALLWWYILENYLMNHDNVTIDGIVYSIKTIEKKEKLFDYLHSIISEQDTTDCKAWFERNNIAWKEINQQLNDNLCMNWDEIRELSHNTLCTIGSHTITHARLTKQTREICKQELSLSKNIIENKINKHVLYFSYPYGNYNSQIMRYVRESGYKLGLLCNGGSVLKNNNVYSIPRTKY